MVDPNDLKEILYNISKKIIVPSFGNLKSNQISYKNEKDIVTEIDLAVEQELSLSLPKLLKNSNFIGEEIYAKNPSILKYYLFSCYNCCHLIGGSCTSIFYTSFYCNSFCSCSSNINIT